MGGLGNNLFQILYSLSQKRNFESTYFISALCNRNLLTKLLGWKIHPNYSELFTNCQIRNDLKIIDALFLFVTRIFFHQNLLKGVTLNFHRKSYSIGYFQEFKFNKHITSCVNDIRATLDVNKMHPRKYLVIHFRGMDSIWARRNMNYYKCIKELFDNKNSIVITDDLELANKFFKNAFIKKPAKSAIEDFYFLLSAEVLVIAPSTFSYWAGILGNARIVYYPSELDLPIPQENEKIYRAL